ncbi:hypothetical protein [Paenibacillus sedimenti]|uniref:Uncharacterized protein n=1 Tax=Paenibacillus sedimenti TaxID=2770274 RepID=A0A926KNH9_9BACL|nr:hypothetical protein [Paenibacillus sedimenti]MBD0380970.1 hypothetical protein [Paenibacillus sedimenti]
MSKIKMLLLSFLVIIVMSIFIVDYKRAVRDMPPLFAIRTDLYKDGGTSVYLGFGYKIIDYNQVDGRKDIVFKSLIISKGK